MAIKAKQQTREDILKCFEQIQEYRSHYKILMEIKPDESNKGDVFNEEIINDEKCINFLIDLSEVLAKYDVEMNGANGRLSSFKVNDKNIGARWICDLIGKTNEDMEETLNKWVR